MKVSIKSLCLAFLLLFLYKFSYSQEVNAQNHQFISQKADSLGQVFMYDSAATLYSLLADYYQGVNEDQYYQKARSMQIQTLVTTPGWAQAEALARQFIEELDKTGNDTTNYKAEMYRVLGTVNESYKQAPSVALKQYRKAISLVKPVSGASRLTSDLYKDLATTNFQLAYVDSTLWYFKKAVTNMSESSQPDSAYIARTLRQIAVVNQIINQPQEALSYGKKALTYLKNERETSQYLQARAEVYQLLSSIYRSLEKLDSSFYYSSASQEINLKIYPPTDNRLAIGYQNLANITMVQNKYIQSEKALQKALEIALQNPDEDPLLLVYIYNNLGGIYYDHYGSYNRVIEYYEKALTLLDSMSGIREDQMRVQLATNIAMGYSEKASTLKHLPDQNIANELYRHSIEMTDKAIENAKKLPNFDPAELVRFHTNQGINYRDLGNWDKSQKEFDLAQGILRKLENPNSREKALVNRAIGYLLALQGKPEAAHFFEKAENHLLAFQGTQGKQLTLLYNLWAQSHIHRSEFTEARKLLQKSLASNKITFTSGEEETSATESPDSHISINQHLTTLRYLAMSYGAAEDLNSMKEGIKRYQSFADYSKKAIVEQTNLKDQLVLFNIIHGGYLEYIQLATDLAMKLPDEGFDIEALKATHLSSAFLLKASQKEERDHLSELLPQDLLESQSAQESNILALTSEYINATTGKDKAKLLTIQSKLFDARSRLFELNRKLLREHPQYFHLKYEIDETPLDELQSHLSEDQNVIEYVVNETKIQAFIISSENLKLTELQKPQDFDSLVIDFRASILNKDRQNLLVNGQKLYRILFEPIAPYLTGKRIQIIPNSSLWNLNFDLLIQPDDTDSSEFQPDYLINHYAFSYAYSVEHYTAQKSPERSGMVAFSYSANTDKQPDVNVARSSLIDLPGAAAEVEKLSDLFQGQFYFGRNASEANFKSVISNQSVIHLAIHGEIDEREYDQSRLYFSKEDTSATEDNVLYPFELYKIKVNADMVALTACQSGSGLITMGEGVMSVGRAFQFAGVNSLLLSMWDVSDGTAPQIVIDFYDNLNRGMTKDVALQQAKLKYMENTDNLTSAPYYWSSFYILGDSSPISIKAKADYIQVVIILCLLLLTISLGVRRRLKKKK